MKYRLGANGDWLASIDAQGEMHLQNVYNAVNIQLPPISAQGFEALHLQGTHLFRYNNAIAKLLKVAIAQPPSRLYGYRYCIVLVVFNIALAVNTGDNLAESSWTLMSPATLAPEYYEGLVCHGGRICVVTSGGTCLVWDPTSYG